MIVRQTYLDRLKSLKNQDLIKVITGIRRCGKSTLLKSFQKYLVYEGVANDCIVDINFEERENADFLSWIDVYDSIVAKMNTVDNYYVFLDEVQSVPQFEKLIDALYVKKNIDLYITGSNAYLLSSELATLLSGRYITINLHPFSFKEYVENFPEEHSYDRLFRQYINTSCFPEAVSISKSSPENVNIYLKSLYETVVVKDIIKHYRLRKFDSLQNIIDFLFDSVGSIVSPNNIAEVLSQNKSSVSHNTVKKLITYLTESYLIYPVRLYNLKGKKLLESNYKYYVVDLGLKNILLTNHYDADLGHKLENVVFFELLRRGGEVFVGRYQNTEVDFVVKKYDGTIEYYQVAFVINDEKTLNREISSLLKIKDANPKYLLTLDFDNSVIDGIRKINVVDWLLS
ncbi:MAG: ATP-binding protein [Bacteroidales bacterium]|nr:ATP-binding protein [Bacteroidales bacterium]